MNTQTTAGDNQLPTAEPSEPPATAPTDWVMLQVQMPLDQMRSFVRYEKADGEPVTARDAEMWNDAVEQIRQAAEAAVAKASGAGAAA